MNVRTQMQSIVFQEYTKVIQMNERYSTMNNNANVRPVSTYSTPSSSEISPVPSPGSSSATQRYYESFTEKPAENSYYGIPTDNWEHDFLNFLFYSKNDFNFTIFYYNFKIQKGII